MSFKTHSPRSGMVQNANISMYKIISLRGEQASWQYCVFCGKEITKQSLMRACPYCFQKYLLSTIVKNTEKLLKND